MSWILSKFFGSRKRPSEDEGGLGEPVLKKRHTEEEDKNPYEQESSFSFSSAEFDVGSTLSSALVPRPLVLVTSFDKEGGLTIAPSSFCSVVSTSPAYVSIGLPKDALPEDMGIVQNKEFTVNTVSRWMADAATKTVGAYNLPDTEADLKTGITTTASVQVKVPRVAEAAVTLECRLRHKYDIKDSEGDVASTIVIAEVVCMVVNNGVLVTAADGSHVVDAKLLKPVAALGNGVWGGIAASDVHTPAAAAALADAQDPFSAAPASPATPGKPEEEAREVAGVSPDVAEVVATAVAEALEQQPDAPEVKEVSVLLASATEPAAPSREPTPISVLVQQAE